MALANYKTAGWVALKRFTYVGQQLEPGEYCDPRFATNDRVIFAVDSRYVGPAPAQREEWKCDRCGRYFVTEGHLRGHQRHLYQIENTDPEHVASLREEEGRRVGRRLKETTLADIAERAGHDVRVNEAGVPMIQRQ